MIAVLLKILTAVVTVYHGGAIWEAGLGCISSDGLLVLFGALEVASLANVWVQALPRIGRLACSGTVRCGQNAAPVLLEARGYEDV